MAMIAKYLGMAILIYTLFSSAKYLGMAILIYTLFSSAKDWLSKRFAQDADDDDNEEDVAEKDDLPITQMASSSHTIVASSSRSFKYDVFLSFRGEDVRKTFVDHLYSALKQSSIITYKDDEALPRGESIRPALFMAIEESRIAVIVFSKNYADSSWCLDELAHIMKCKEETKLTVMPVFYDVNPSDVRKQEGDFGKAFAKQEVENINKAQLWKNALVDASNIAGWEPKHVADGHESKVIKEIVETVLGRLSPLNTDVDEDLVGMATRLQDLISQLEIGSEGVRMVGIWGGGGSGKTTLATSLYMEICHQFQGFCILENVREESNKCGLSKLQEKMLSAIFKRAVVVPSIAEGKHEIKTMLCRRNVLIVLDDVNDIDQLHALAGSHHWFGSGSRILITTRDEHLLRTHKVDKVCHGRLLSNDEAMQLFNRHAYNEKQPIKDYKSFSLRVVSYAAGLPLALKVLGSFLYDKDKNGWISTLERIKDIPEMEIVEKLKISYDGLKPMEKELFLDIACFWRGKWKSEAMDILEACGYHPVIGIEVLKQKALITVAIDGRFDMHDLVQEMGHYIVRGEYPNNVEEHSRIWINEEINKMCLTMENDKIQAITYSMDYVTPSYVDDHALDQIHFYRSFSNMKKLKCLRVKMSLKMSPKYAQELSFLSNELRYIKWIGYGGTSFPDNFHPTKLVYLMLEHSMQIELWKGNKHIPHLKVLELDSMHNLLSTPEFDRLPCLQKLKLRNCSELKNIHPSLGNHTSIQKVIVSGCDELRMFPTIVHMENLKTLRLEQCENIREFPEIQTNMESLQKLSLYGTGIEVMPSSVGERCTNLIFLKFSPYYKFTSIESNFELKLQGLTNLQELWLDDNKFERIDSCLVQCTRLKLLSLSCCKRLLGLPELPSSLTILNAQYCGSLTTLGDCYKNCTRLCQVLLRSSIINDGEKLVEHMLEVCSDIENCPKFIQIEGAEVAKWFIPRLHGGRRFRLQLPENWSKDFSGFLMCTVRTEKPWSSTYVIISMEQVMSDMDFNDDAVWEKPDGHEYLTDVWYIPFGSLRHATWWDQTYKALSFNIVDYSIGSGRYCAFGIRLIEKKSRNALMETSTNSSTDYTPRLHINDDSKSGLRISLSTF